MPANTATPSGRWNALSLVALFACRAIIVLKTQGKTHRLRIRVQGNAGHPWPPFPSAILRRRAAFEAESDVERSSHGHAKRARAADVCADDAWRVAIEDRAPEIQDRIIEHVAVSLTEG